MHPVENKPTGRPQAEPHNVLAIVSLVSSLLAWIAVPLIGAIVAVVCGHMARAQLRFQPNESSNIMAVLGLVIGYTQIVLLLLLLAAVLVFGWAIFQAHG